MAARSLIYSQPMQAFCYAADDWFDRDAPVIGEAVGVLKSRGLAGVAWPWTDSDDPAQLGTLVRTLHDAGLQLVALAARMDIHQPTLTPSHIEMIQFLAGRGTLLDITFISTSSHDTPSAPRGDPRAAVLLGQILPLAQRYGVAVSLCPRHGCWLAKTQDAVRLGMRINNPALGTTFNLSDWREADGSMLDARLDIAIPRLANVTLDTSHPAETARLVQRLLTAGYAGPVGLRRSGQTGEWQHDLAAVVRAYVAAVK